MHGGQHHARINQAPEHVAHVITYSQSWPFAAATGLWCSVSTLHLIIYTEHDNFAPDSKLATVKCQYKATYCIDRHIRQPISWCFLVFVRKCNNNSLNRGLQYVNSTMGLRLNRPENRSLNHWHDYSFDEVASYFTATLLMMDRSSVQNRSLESVHACSSRSELPTKPVV
jgi:hypothetical protein